MGEGRRSLQIGVGFANEQYLQKRPLWLVKIQTDPFSCENILGSYTHQLSKAVGTCSYSRLHLPPSPRCLLDAQLSPLGLVIASSLVTLKLIEKICAPGISSKVLRIKEQDNCEESSHLENRRIRNNWHLVYKHRIQGRM